MLMCSKTVSLMCQDKLLSLSKVRNFDFETVNVTPKCRPIVIKSNQSTATCDLNGALLDILYKKRCLCKYPPPKIKRLDFVDNSVKYNFFSYENSVLLDIFTKNNITFLFFHN